MLDPECYGDVLDGLDVVFAVNQKLDGRVDGDGLGGVEACYPCIGGCRKEGECRCDEGGGAHFGVRRFLRISWRELWS